MWKTLPFSIVFWFKKRYLTYQVSERLIISYEKQCWFSCATTFSWIWPLVLPTHNILCMCFPFSILILHPFGLQGLFRDLFVFLREPVFHFHAKSHHGHDFSLWFPPTHCLLCRCFSYPCLSYIPLDFKVFSVFYSFIWEPVFHFHA